MYNLSQKLAAEFIGSAFLLATVVGSGIMAEQLSGGNVALALLGNTIPTGAILFVLITMFGPISGAHFNPAVTLVFYLRQELTLTVSLLYVVTQIVAGLTGVVLAHIMFNLDVLQFSQKGRVGVGQWVSEFIATFGLIMTILTTLKFKECAVAMAVGLYITAAYWFTASTSFANPAVSIARAFSNTFAGIKPAHVGFFIVCQLLAAVSAWLVCSWLLKPRSDQ